MKKKVELIFMDAGGGHRASATALKAVLAIQIPDWEVTMTNVFDIIDPTHLFKRITGIKHEDVYNIQLNNGWTIGMKSQLKIFQAEIKFFMSSLKKKMYYHWNISKPDMVVSLIPNFNKPLFESVRQLSPNIPYVTILTDIADTPPHFWIEDQDQYFICGSSKASAQALLKHPFTKVFQTSGMILNPKFYYNEEIPRNEILQSNGFDSNKPIGLVMFGGYGSKKMETIAKVLPTTQLIMVCGNNVKLAAALGKIKSVAPRLIVGFTTDMPMYMKLADFFIGKPGPGSITEAVKMHLPVIIESNSLTMPQEQYNATWVKENNVGVSISKMKYIPNAVKEITSNLDKYKNACKAINNQAVFEIPKILQTIMPL